MKRCKKCGKDLPLEEFSKHPSTKDRKQPQCKPCRSNQKKQWKKDNPKLVKEQERNRFLKYKYGIDNDYYNKLLEEQGNVCAICGCSVEDERVHGDYFAVDHCHHTIKVRGLLCRSCNVGIGNLNDDPVLLQMAINYLVKHTHRIQKELNE